MFACMEARDIALILISFLLGLLCIHRIRLLDRYEKEPFVKLALATLLGGGSAMILALGLFEVIERLGFQNFESYTGTLLVIGPVEEMAKLAGLMVVLGIIRNELNEPSDGIIYISCVALGFSLIENILYASRPSDEYLLFIRLLTATPLHICFSALMGLTFYLWYKNRNAFHLLMTGFLSASFSHGLYDLVLFNHYSVLPLGCAVFLTYWFARDLFIYSIAVSPHRISLAQALGAANGVEAQKGPGCMHCGADGEERLYTIEKLKLWYCRHCDRFTVDLDGLYRLFYHFAGILKPVAKKNLRKDKESQGCMTLYQGNCIYPESRLAVFQLRELDDVLEKLNYALKARMKSRWYLPNNLFRLNQPGTAIDYPRMLRDGQKTLWNRLVLPFSPTRRRNYRPPVGGPAWQWGAFFLPEVWYPVHGLWGLLLPVAGCYLFAVYLAVTNGFSISQVLGITILFVRVISGFMGSRIYYRKHGRWP